MLGADIGTAVAAQLLAVDLRLLSPVAMAALLTWLAHASIAMILTVAGLVGAGVVPHAMAVPFVLGANAGAAIAPVVATAGSSPAGRRPALGNLVMRGSGALLALAALPWTAPSSSPISAPARPLS